MFVCSCGSTGNSARNNSATEDPGNEQASQQQFRLFGNGELMAWRVYMTLFQESIQWWTKIQVSCLGYYSLRSKHFQSSYCAYVRARAIKRWKGEEGGGGEGEKFPSFLSPSPVIPFLALVPTFSTNSRGNACYAGQGCYFIIVLERWHASNKGL